MDIKLGRSRIVIVFPRLGLVIKIARIRLFKTIFSIVALTIRHDWHSLRLNIKYTCYREYIFNGLISNINEFIYYWRTKHPFLQPTYFSFFGLINFQKFGRELEIKHHILWVRIKDSLNKEVRCEIEEDDHHFANVNNFCINNNKLRIHDYGHSQTIKIINKFGLIFHEKVSPYA